MKVIRYTLLAEGSSDRALIPIINWLIAQHFPNIGIQSELANNLGKIGTTLKAKVSETIALFPCDVLFVHRDCDRSTYEDRLQEINDAVVSITVSHIPIIPIRMTEAWLFSDELAIRAAAENRNGTIPLNLPDRKKWETVPDPKDILFATIKLASEKSGRALQRFNHFKSRARVTELTRDFSSLRGISSFDRFEASLIEVFRTL